MQDYRHYLHSIPEINYEEFKTSEYIYNKLIEFKLEVVKDIAGTGVIGILESQDGNKSKNIALRAELDGLPIQENNTFSHKSLHKNKMHACGHDGHMAILLGVAEYFSQNRTLFSGIIYFIFTPAEEEGAGCKLLIDNDYFKSLEVQEIYALHNWMELNVNEIGISDNVIMGGDDNFSIKIIGKGGHGAMPEYSINPNNYIGRVINNLKEIEKSISEKILLTPTNIISGDTYNVIPEYAIINGTLRYLSRNNRNKAISMLNKITYPDILIEIKIIEGYIPTVNNKECAKYCKDIVNNMNIKLINIENPSMATEDFSYLLDKIKGCYVWLGSNDNNHINKLHTVNYDFNDNVLNIGYTYFKKLIYSRLPQLNSSKSSIISLPTFKKNLIFLGFIQVPTDYTLDMDINDVLTQIDGIGWRIKKLPNIGCININKENFEKWKNELQSCASGFVYNSKYNYGGLSLLSLACTSMSFVLGKKVIDEELKKGYNIETNDTTTSILNAINLISHTKNTKKIKVSVLTPYIDDIHQWYLKLLNDNNCQIIVDHNMNLANDSLTSSVTEQSLLKIIEEMISINSDIDAFLIICSALNVTKKGFIDTLEHIHEGLYFITSNQALLWNSLKMALPKDHMYKINNVKGYGKLFTL